MKMKMNETTYTLIEYYNHAARNQCKQTVDGWLWYCDAHDTHGSADSKGEAEAVASAHERYKSDVDRADECDIWIVEVTDG